MIRIKIFSLFMAIATVMSSLILFAPATATAAEPVTNAVAEIAETGVKYSTLEEAVDKVANGQTIRLLKNCTVASGGGLIIDRGISFTIDGKGYTLTNTITQSSPATGTIYAKSGTTIVKNLTVNSQSGVSTYCGALISRYTATLVVENCNINVSGTTGYCSVLVNDGATLSFKGTNIIRSTINGFWIKGTSIVNTIDGGKVIAVAKSFSDAVTDAGITCVTSSSATATVAILGTTAYTTIDSAVTAAISAGGTIELLCNTTVASTTVGIEVPTSTKNFTIDGNGFKLSSSTSNPYRGTIYVAGGEVTIKNLTFDTQTSNANSWGAVLTNNTGKAILENCEVQVTGTGAGAFGLNGSSIIEIRNTKVKTTLAKLVYFHSTNAKFIATDSTYTAASLGTSSISGLTLKHEAAIGNTKYITLVDAFAAAREGDTVKLLDDINVVTTGTNGRIKCYAGGFNITLDGNGKKISSTADVALAFHYQATSGEDNGGVCRVTVKNLSVECNAPSGSGVAIQTNTSTVVTLDGCDIRTKGSNIVGAVVVQPSSKFIAKGGTTITADTGYAIRLNGASADTTIYDATTIADYAVYSENANTFFNVREGALLDSRVNTLASNSTAGMTFNMTGGKLKIAKTDRAVIEAPNTSFKINLFGGSFEGGNAIYNNAADSKKNIAYTGSEMKAEFLPTMTDGASVRLAAEASGIRFETIVSKSLIDHANAIKDTGTVVSYGTIITPAAYLGFTDGLFTMEALDNSALNGAKYQRIVADNGITDDEGGSKSFRASLVNIRLKNYSTGFAARGYVSYTVNGTTEYVYADYNEENNARSVLDVTYAALADVKPTVQGIYITPVTSYLKLNENGGYSIVQENAYSRFSTEQLELLNNYYNGELNHVPGIEETLSDTTLNVASNLTSTFRQLGRGYVRNSGLACDFTCTGIEFNAYCAGSVYMKVNSSAATYWTVYVDGVRQPNRVLSNPNSTGWIELAYGIKAGDHTISIIKQSQFTMSTNEILEIKVRGRFNQAPEDKEMFLEFYGDSILNGSNIHTGGTSPATSDGTLAFGWLTAQALGADCNIIGRGGLGVINPSSGGYCMMDIYDLNGSRFVSGVTKYNFARIPDAIVVELGINDKVQSGGVDAATYTSGINQFVSAMRAKYGKDVPIIWLYGYNTNSDYGSTMVEAIKALKNAGDSNLYYCQISPCNVPGASDIYHPDVEKAETMAAEVVAHLKTILNIK